MKFEIGLLSTFAFIALALWWFNKEDSEQNTTNNKRNYTTTQTTPPSQQSQKTKEAIIANIEPSTHHLGKGSEEDDLFIIQSLLRYYCKAFEQNPIGENDEIVAALTGNNAKHVILIKPDHPFIKNGQLLDRWGTPYYFHALSSTSMEVRSAGKDKELYSEDDVTSSPR